MPPQNVRRGGCLSPLSGVPFTAKDKTKPALGRACTNPPCWDSPVFHEFPARLFHSLQPLQSLKPSALSPLHNALLFVKNAMTNSQAYPRKSLDFSSEKALCHTKMTVKYNVRALLLFVCLSSGLCAGAPGTEPKGGEGNALFLPYRGGMGSIWEGDRVKKEGDTWRLWVTMGQWARWPCCQGLLQVRPLKEEPGSITQDPRGPRPQPPPQRPGRTPTTPRPTPGRE